MLRLLLALHIAIFCSLLTSTAWSEDLYLETEIKLQTPKKDSKRSREGGLDHVVFRLWLPEGVETIRGVILNPLYTKAVTQTHWQAACRQWKFGIVATNFFGVKSEEIATDINAALEAFAAESKHPELAQAKMCLVGMSAGAGACTRIAEQLPERVVAVGPVCLEVGPRDAASMQIPMLTIFGERDGSQYEKLLVRLPETRRQGGRFAIAVQWRRRHEFGQANNLLLPMFDAAIQARLAAPGEPLKPLDEASGWLGDISQWKSGEVTIAPYAAFPGDKEGACWFPDADTACAWQAFVAREPKLKLASPPGLGDGQPLVLHTAGEAIEVRIAGKPETKGPIEVYSGAHKLGELQDGHLAITFDKPGFYPVFLKATASNPKPDQSSVIWSRPHTLIVE